MARSKVKSRLYHDATHLQPPTNVPTKYQIPTPYGLRDIARTRFYRSRSLRQGQRSHHDDAHLYPLTNVPTKYQLHTPYSFREVIMMFQLTNHHRPTYCYRNQLQSLLHLSWCLQTHSPDTVYSLEKGNKSLNIFHGSVILMYMLSRFVA